MPVTIDDISTQTSASNERVIPSEAARSVATYTIRSEGNEVSRTYHIVSILVHKELNRIPFATIILVDGDPAAQSFPASDAADFEPGKNLEIKMGYRGTEESVFKGIVVKHGIKARQGSGVLVIECRDAASKMTVAPKSKYSSDVKDSDAIEDLINAHGLDSDIDTTDITHKELVQYNTTDWDFMLCRADANGLLVFVSDGKVSVKKPDLSADAALNIQFGATVFDLDAEIDARLQFSKVTATAWDSAQGEMIDGVEAEDPGAPDTGNISASDLANVMGEDGFSLYHDGQLDQQELQQWANSKMLKNRLAKIRGKVTTEGISTVLPGQMISLQGAGARFEGKLFVTGVRQHLMEGIWKTTFQFGLGPEWFADTYKTEQPLAGALLPAIQGLHIGVVTDLEDPDSQNRIKVRVPTISATEEGIWSRVSTLDAGNNRGTFILPEIDDEVIVGFINNDPRHAVILGMMNSAHYPAPLTASNDNNEKGYVSRSEMKMIFNDDKKTIQIETPAGNKILLTEEDTAIKLEDQNGNTFTMDSDGFKIESQKDIKVSAMGNYDLSDSAGNSIKMEASGITIQAAAKLTLGGAQIEINGAQLSVGAAMAQFSGVIQTPTIIATSVIGTSYTPGAGNIM
ncbi:MAG: type VI secretion system tip protein VgrG [Chitinophagaceae bacterium]